MSKVNPKKNFIISVILAVVSIIVMILDFILLNSVPFMVLFSLYCILPLFGIFYVLFIVKAINSMLALKKGETYISTNKIVSKTTTALLIIAVISNLGLSVLYLFNPGISGKTQNYIESKTSPDSPQLYEMFNISSFTNITENEKSDYTPVSFYTYSDFLKSKSVFLRKDFTSEDEQGRECSMISVEIEVSTNVPSVFNSIRYNMKRLSFPDAKYDENRQCLYSYVLGDYEDSIVSRGTSFSFLSKEDQTYICVHIETYDPDFRIDEEEALEYFKNQGTGSCSLCPQFAR